MNITVVIPCYKCSETLNELHNRLVNSLQKITNDFSIIFVNDNSPEDDWNIIKNIVLHDNRVTGVNLSKNFGQHYAITAGLEFCDSDWVVVMDGDLQDRPEEIIKLFNKALEGYDTVVASRSDRKDSICKKLSSKMFYVLFNYLTNQNLDNRVANFGIYSKKVIDNVKKLKETERSFGLLTVVVGFSRCVVEVEHSYRLRGKSAYSFKSRFNQALNHIISHSNKPLTLAVSSGFILSSLSIIYSFWVLLRYFWTADIPDGWTTLTVSLFFLSGLIIIVIGIVGLYIGKIYNEVKERPLYIIKDIAKQK